MSETTSNETTAGALRTEPRLLRPDDFYNLVMDAHRDLDEEASRKLDAKLVLLLANHIGDLAVIEEAVQIAKGESA